jgi:hypothetical protein
MRIRLYRIIDPTTPIANIKTIRAVTGLGLREAKGVYDRMADTSVTYEPVLTCSGDQMWIEDRISENFYYRPMAEVEESTGDLYHVVRAFLSQAPSHLTVQDLRDVLDAVNPQYN